MPFPSPGDLPNPGMKPESPALRADALLAEVGVFLEFPCFFYDPTHVGNLSLVIREMQMKPQLDI